MAEEEKKEENQGEKEVRISPEIEKYAAILAKDPDSRAFAPLAEAYRRAGMLEEAIHVAREGLDKHPGYLSGRVALGRAFFEKEMLAEAAQELETVAKSSPDNIIAQKILGEIAFRQGEKDKALQHFSIVLTLNPDDKEVEEKAKLLSEPDSGESFSPEIAIPEAESEPETEPETETDSETEAATEPEETRFHSGPEAETPDDEVPGPVPEPEIGVAEEEVSQTEAEDVSVSPGTEPELEALPETEPGDEQPEPAPEPESGEEEEDLIQSAIRRAELDEGVAVDFRGAAGGGRSDDTDVLAPEAEEEVHFEEVEPDLGLEEEVVVIEPGAGESPLVEPFEEAGEGREEQTEGEEISEEEEAGIITEPEDVELEEAVAEAEAEEAETGEAIEGVELERTIAEVEPEEVGLEEAVAEAEPGEMIEDVEPEGILSGESGEEIDFAGEDEDVTIVPPSGGERIATATMAEIYVKQGHLEKALEIYREILAGDPDNQEAEERMKELSRQIEVTGEEAGVSPDLQAEAGGGESATERKIRALQLWRERIQRFKSERAGS